MDNDSQEFKFEASIDKWQEFIDGPVWRDLQRFLADKSNYKYEQLAATYEERQRNDGDIENDDIIRGRIREIYDLIHTPEILLEDIKLQESQEEETEPK